MEMEEADTAVDLPRATRAMREFLTAVGVDPAVHGMEDTPARVAALYAELFSGLCDDPQTLWAHAMTEETDGLVAVRTIPFHAVCEHHLLPFFGTAHIVYRPHAGRVAGFGVFTELVGLMARRPQPPHAPSRPAPPHTGIPRYRSAGARRLQAPRARSLP